MSSLIVTAILHTSKLRLALRFIVLHLLLFSLETRNTTATLTSASPFPFLRTTSVATSSSSIRRETVTQVANWIPT